MNDVLSILLPQPLRNIESCNTTSATCFATICYAAIYALKTVRAMLHSIDVASHVTRNVARVVFSLRMPRNTITAGLHVS